MHLQPPIKKPIGRQTVQSDKKMLTIERTIICVANTTRRPQKNGRRRSSTAALAKKRDFSKNSTTNQTIFPVKLSKSLLAQSAITVFALGFIDAGYSGDWSRIGVISKDSEDLLKSAAFLLVPFCIFLVFSFSKKLED